MTIGERCVIGANSVVTSDLPPGTIAAGVPARPIGKLDARQGDVSPRGRVRHGECL